MNLSCQQHLCMWHGMQRQHVSRGTMQAVQRDIGPMQHCCTCGSARPLLLRTAYTCNHRLKCPPPHPPHRHMLTRISRSPKLRHSQLHMPSHPHKVDTKTRPLLPRIAVATTHCQHIRPPHHLRPPRSPLCRMPSEGKLSKAWPHARAPASPCLPHTRRG